MVGLQKLQGVINDFDAFTTDIGDVVPDWKESKRSDGVMVRSINAIKYQNQVYTVGDRFILSLCSKFGIGISIFSFFDPGEVFERIQLIHPRTRVRIVTDKMQCLAATTPTKPYVEFSTLVNILSRPSRANNIVHAHYNDGIATTVHIMKEAPWEIGGESFQQAFTLETPIDGYGLPSIYLSLIRKSNGTVLTAGSKTFRSEIQLGKMENETEIPLTRALHAFNNEEGFQALRQRLASAQQTCASVHECSSLLKSIASSVMSQKQLGQSFYEQFNQMAGDVSQKYGIATEDSLSPKKARLLPMNCMVLDLIFFSMVVLRNQHINYKPIVRWVGQLIENEYDLEGADDCPNGN